MRKLGWLLKLALITAIHLPSPAFAESGIVSTKSAHDAETTVDRLTSILDEKGMRVFTLIDHAAGARSVGLELRPSYVVIFGNPKIGTLLMQCEQQVAIDLPQKALIYQDQAGQVWLSYNDPSYLAARHQLSGCDAVLKKISTALATFARLATQP
mgnify:CR=1 FL=1|tara:strand:- start:1769 stop:2233 length:465 start_codon:yes stop_codon:yes gene_type:complete